MLDKWDARFLAQAAQVSTWSKDPSTQTGAVIVNSKKKVLSVGFNGFPQGIKDDWRLGDRGIKYEMIIHCEINALIFAEASLDGCTLYTYPFLSCSRCAAIMIQAGVTRVVAPKAEERPEKTFNMGLTRALYYEAKVEVLEVE